MKVCPVILAGGSGTRLWPLSREHFPKQLLPLHGEGTLLQQTARRTDGLGDGVDLAVDRPVVVCNEEHRFLIAEQLRETGRTAASILLEPVARNTAPALTLAALRARGAGDDPVLLVMPADHVITDIEGFQRAVRSALVAAGKGLIATFGIVPDRPETGYGYIETGEPLADLGAEGRPEVRQVAGFVEKPDRETALRYLESGRFLWNSGMFVVAASVWLDAIERYRPDIAAACRSALEGGRSDADFCRVDAASFSACPSDSIDYAVMERLARDAAQGVQAAALAAVVPLQAGWSDVGAWSAIWEIGAPDGDGNVKRGDVYAYDTRGSLLLSEHRLLAAVGVRDLVVIETPDAVMVADRHRAQDVKRVVEWLKAQGREEGRTHRRVYRPWGSYESLDTGERFQVKRLSLKPGAAISLQMHHHRAEHWVVVRGTATVTRGEERFLLTENQSTFIPIGATHRLENAGKVPLEIVEVQSGGYLGEDDIVRFEDRYDRMPEPCASG